MLIHDQAELQDRELLKSRTLQEIEALIQEAEAATRPLEVDPARSRLFELFAAAYSMGCLIEGGPGDLTADELCRELAERSGLKQAANQAVQQQSAIPPTQMTRMRSLWSIMRMWMEWTYAWDRRAECRFDENVDSAASRAPDEAG